MTKRSRMSLIMDPVGQEYQLFALEIGKIAIFDFVYTLASTNINQSTLNLVKMCMTISSQLSMIMGQIRPNLPLNKENWYI